MKELGHLKDKEKNWYELKTFNVEKVMSALVPQFWDVEGHYDSRQKQWWATLQ